MTSFVHKVPQHWQCFTIGQQLDLTDFEKVTQKHQDHFNADYAGLTLATALQPIFSIDHQRIIGYEALIRGKDKNAQPVSAIDLLDIPSNEEESIHLDRLCRYLHINNFQKISDDNNWLFLNISAQASVKGRSYGLFFAELLKRFNIKPQNVVVEIIEDPTTDNDQLLASANYYKNMGCLLAIDDFGAGHSNFERVWNLKPDIVKLDRTLLVRALSSDKTQNLLNSLVDLLHQAGCLVVIEGVEDEEQALIAMDSGADFIQGYYFAKPQEKALASLEKTDIFKKLANKYINQQKEINEKHADSVESYCRSFREAVLNLQQGLNFITACQPLAELNKSIRCFLTDELGNQITNTLLFKDNSLSNGKFKQLKLSENANWFRKHYIRHAIEHPSRMYISRPYRSITGDGLCSTISVAFKILGKTHVLCFDMEPHN
ncbi:EAL domain-containing protein [Thalassotalea agariperforans]